MALLSRNEGAFRADLIAAQEALVKYFDTRAVPPDRAGAAAQVQSSNLAIEMPTPGQPERCAQLQSEAIVCVYSSG
jgi:uroporphyrin-3 C-methyltransferase/uroporphyrinogen III methyltransferase/synthase